ncbi:uncharacterized protein LOC143445001 [Clavelina lepadiformis]|uniref:uncharacterized protein LOC143445001 n=1 Tax=Clavelina lepadiformis TaxID=159417 RepID=UPI0040416811
MCYGAECWAMKKVDIRRMQTTEMRMIRTMCGKTLRDGIANDVLRRWTGVEDIEKHLRGHRLRWLEHIERMNEESLTRIVQHKMIEGKVKRGIPKKTREETVKDDMRRRGLKIEDAIDRGKWRRRCRQLVDPEFISG